MSVRGSALKLLLVALAVLSLGVGMSACGSSSSQSTAESTEQSGEAEAESESTEQSGEAEAEAGGELPEYNGPANEFPTAFPEPTKEAGLPFKFGYLQNYEALPALRAVQSGVENEVKRLGGTTIVKDSELNPQKQVQQFEEMLAEGVNAIGVFPNIPKSLTPQLEKAKAAGVPVIATGARPDVSKPLPKGYLSDVEQSFDYEAYLVAKAVAEAKPGATFAVMKIGPPVEAVRYGNERQRYWGEQLGLKFEGYVVAKEDTPSGYSEATATALNKWPDVDALLCYSDQSALTAATGAKAAGRTDLLVTGKVAEKPAVEAVKDGTLLATVSLPWEGFGEQVVKGAYDVLTETKLPETIILKSTLVTKANVEEVEPLG
jgi:ribose transport system substrate-binding protein